MTPSLFRIHVSVMHTKAGVCLISICSSATAFARSTPDPARPSAPWRCIYPWTFACMTVHVAGVSGGLLVCVGDVVGFCPPGLPCVMPLWWEGLPRRLRLGPPPDSLGNTSTWVHMCPNSVRRRIFWRGMFMSSASQARIASVEGLLTSVQVAL
jgi:hypothetical protein